MEWVQIMTEIGDIVAVVCVILAVIIAILSTTLKDIFGELLLLAIEVILLIVIIGTAIYGQRISRPSG